MGIRDHPDLAGEVGSDRVHVDGSLHWEEDASEARLATLRQSVCRPREWGWRIDRATPEQVTREIEPDLWTDPSTASDGWSSREMAGWT
ncbi:MAG: hypothetical protein IT307_06705, partial [Chloroflexi bacterium]|nr:hypothetical protein [Chloroflexota bacterium]